MALTQSFPTASACLLREGGNRMKRLPLVFGLTLGLIRCGASTEDLAKC